jgi:hypothetical protein
MKNIFKTVQFGFLGRAIRRFSHAQAAPQIQTVTPQTLQSASGAKGQSGGRQLLGDVVRALRRRTARSGQAAKAIRQTRREFDFGSAEWPGIRERQGECKIG